MSPEAIQSLIEMFGVEKGVQILNLFTVQPESLEEEEPALPVHRPELIRSRRKRARPPARETVEI